MELKNYEPKQIINLFYKILYDLEKHYTYNISKGNLIPSFDVVEEEEFKNDLLTLENACDTYKTACLENAGWELLTAYLLKCISLSTTYFVSMESISPKKWKI